MSVTASASDTEDMPRRFRVPTATHWGCYYVEVEQGRITGIHPYENDPDPSPLGHSLATALDSSCRIERPAIRAGYFEKKWRSDKAGRGAEPFIPVSWDEALDITAAALSRVKTLYGNEAIYAGSYGWASAGRFHHAQSQIHRFMNQFGGYTRSVDTYSTAAGDVVLRHVLGPGTKWVVHAPSWQSIATNAELVVSFGGLPLKNSQVNAGIVGRHTAKEGLRRCHDAGVEFAYFSPIRQDMPEFLAADWFPLRPNTDTAVMLGLAHTLVDENKVDRPFLDRYCHGFDHFLPYLMGERDGQPKDAAWAERISGIPADTLRNLALRMAERRTLLSVSWSVQRADHGEQPYWMAVVLAAMLGQIGLPGCGIGFGICAVNGVGQPRSDIDWAALEQGQNSVETFIPVARISDMLLNPGSEIDYNGQRIRFPDIKLIHWAGGNPFHHHQDLNRLLLAWRKPETIIVHEPWWTATARHADIVLPTTTALERDDFACSALDSFLTPMRQAVQPLGDSRNDFDIFAALAKRLGFHDRFTEGRDAVGWVRFLYLQSRERALERGIELPDFETFWASGPISVPLQPLPNQLDPLAAFRTEPKTYPLSTPSGKIEIFSETIDGFGYGDCPGHPMWLEPKEWLGSPTAQIYPLHLISNQPKTRLHSQLDHGSVSRVAKLRQREPILINPADAASRNLTTGDVVRVFNDRGSCLAGVLVNDSVRPGVVQIATGAWYDPLIPGALGTLDRHGNPNILSRDQGSSRLAQGPSAQSVLVEIELYHGELPPVEAFEPPPITQA